MAIIRYYVGSMFAGKSYHALQLLVSTHAHHKIVIAPTARKRGFITRREQLDQLDKHIYLFDSVASIPSFLLQTKAKTTIMIDEVQFNQEEAFWSLVHKAQHHDHLQLILSGLEYDQHGQFFPNHSKLLQEVHTPALRYLYVPCATCHNEEGAISIRKWHTQDRITDDYAVLCLECFGKYYQASTASDQCQICHKVTHYLHPLRQWRHDDATMDTCATLCTPCYHNIKNYGLKG